ncbi:MAG TPA: glycosyltransferase family 4 protein [Thermomicrobiaceae bacterium]|nr:glycosyltransferase family 4 protein [Thermomicrobiaceae bacterium]
MAELRAGPASTPQTIPGVYMLGTFGLRPKATLSRRALGMAHALAERGWRFQLGTTPWDNPADAGACWIDGDVLVRNTHVTRPLLWPLAARELTRWATPFRPALVHLFKPKGFGDLAARRLARRLPVVVDMDDWEGDGGWNDVGGYGFLARRLFDWQERSWPRCGVVITAASQTLAERALELGAAPERVHYIPNGLTRARFGELAPQPGASGSFRALHGLGDDPLVLLYTRFVEFAPESIAAALAALRRRRPETRLVIAGGSADGRAEAALRGAAQRAGLNDAIVWLGWIEPRDLASITAASDVAIHPFDDTRLNASKSPVKLLELLASGLPVVTTAVGENRHVVEDGTSGLLAPPGDTEALAARVAELLAAPERRRAIGAAGRQRVERAFLWQGLAPLVETAYRDALGPATPSAGTGRAGRGEQR